jgi:hypothetical protein
MAVETVMPPIPGGPYIALFCQACDEPYLQPLQPLVGSAATYCPRCIGLAEYFDQEPEVRLVPWHYLDTKN